MELARGGMEGDLGVGAGVEATKERSVDRAKR